MASVTINTTAAEDTRISVAFGADLGTGANATAAQVKAAIRQFIVNKVQAYEQAQQAAAASAAVTPIAPT